VSWRGEERMEILFREGGRVVGEREGDGREGGRMRWVLTLHGTLSQQQILIQPQGCSRCNFCISSSSSLRERDPSMYKDVRSLKLLPVMSEEKHAISIFAPGTQDPRSQISFFR